MYSTHSPTPDITNPPPRYDDSGGVVYIFNLHQQDFKKIFLTFCP